MNPRLGRNDWGVLGFTLIYMALAGYGALTTGNREFVVYLGIMAALIGVTALVHLRVGFGPALLWALSVWGMVHMAGGLVHVPEGWPIEGETRVLYNLWLVPGRLKFDMAVHAYGFGVATWACWQSLKVGAGVSRPTFGLVVLCALAGAGLGALNEVLEFITTRLVPKTNVGGYVNTGWDLVFNLLGATVAASLIWWRGRESRGQAACPDA